MFFNHIKNIFSIVILMLSFSYIRLTTTLFMFQQKLTSFKFHLYRLLVLISEHLKQLKWIEVSVHYFFHI